MGGAGPLCRALIGLTVLALGVGGLRQINQEKNCSQPGIQCTIKNSSCFDISWFRPYPWTPAAPSKMEVAVEIGQNEDGLKVPVLQINWTVSIDYSILQLQGVEISVLELSTQKNLCVQFQFDEPFPSQSKPNRQPWQFNYSNFEVIPGNIYHVTVQHLPKEEGINFKEQILTVPVCDKGDLRQTSTCCNLGYCWFPNIEIKLEGENLIVEFSTRYDAQEYGVQVKIGNEPYKVERVSIQQESPIQRKRVTFPSRGGYRDTECMYNVLVWPYMPSCENNCLRLYHAPPCATETPPPPEPVERWYLWFVAVLLTSILFAGIILALRCKACLDTSEKQDPVPPPPLPPPTRKKVWLIYSADNRYYMTVVIRLADFMRLAWGLDVVLDRLHVQEMGKIGSMAWLGRQKDEIERTNGTILILCSRGVQEKWKAMQKVKDQKITLREDREHLIEDLFTPALSLILPDFQKTMPYDRYVVAYFSSISTLADIPSLLEICPKYSLTENLQDLFFRIQRQEQHQPHVQLTVSYKEDSSYPSLVKTIERCRKWQESNSGWFEKECLISVEDLEDTEEEEEDEDESLTRKVYPLICYPETSVSVVEPLILKPDPAKVLVPTLVIGTPSTQVEPFLSNIDYSVSVVQPLVQVPSAVVCIQEPHLVDDPLLGDLNESLLKQDISIQSDQGVLSIEQVREAQERFFFENQDLSSDMEFVQAPGQGMEFMDALEVPILDVARDQPVSEQSREILLDGQLMTPEINPATGLSDRHSIQLADQGYSTWNPYEMDLKAIQMESLKLFLQNEGGMLNFEQV